MVYAYVSIITLSFTVYSSTSLQTSAGPDLQDSELNASVWQLLPRVHTVH